MNGRWLGSRRGARLLGCVSSALLAVAASAADGRGQESFATGQAVVPAFEGWEQNEDGSFNLVFGYLNRNWEEVLDVPVGPANALEPGGPDRGQPTHFLPRRNRFVFRIRVPADFGDGEVVWTLTTNGRTERAYGTLKGDYFVDNGVIQANFGAGGAAGTTPELPDNLAPTLTIEGEATRTVAVGEPLTLSATVTDDGKPRGRALARAAPGLPGPITTDTATGLRFSWFVYRGVGSAVVFSPTQIKVWEDTRPGMNAPWSPGFRTPPPPEDGRWTVTATFSRPGRYTLRGIAHDGGLAVAQDVIVVVRRPGADQGR